VSSDPLTLGGSIPIECSREATVLHRTRVFSLLRGFTASGLLSISFSFAFAQKGALSDNAPPDSSVASELRELKEQVQELRQSLAEMRAEEARDLAETKALREELRAGQLSALPAANPASTSQPTSSMAAEIQTTSQPQPRATDVSSLDQRVTLLEEDSQLLKGKVDEQYQTKVESASKFRVRLSGIVLMNLFSNRGAVDNQDFPQFVSDTNPINPRGSLGATLRQSEIGLEVFGPRLAGANTTGDVQFDFAGGFPSTLNGVTSGLMRLRTATLRFDWQHTSIVGGQDTAFFSPLSPTSFASLAVPAFGYAGNLWAWIPQVRVEHRFDLSDANNLTLQAGIVDNLSGEPPVFQSSNIPQAGERSGQPAYATRIAWQHTIAGRPLTLGAAAYYGRQDWWFGRHVDSWAGMADWDVPLAPRLSLSGEFYRGRGIGEFGAGVGRSVVYNGPLNVPASQVLGLDSIGGWSQLKFRASERLEFNGAFGLDQAFAGDLRLFAATQSYVDPNLLQNRSYLVNVIYRPHTNLLFSAEYKGLRTVDLDDYGRNAQQMNLTMGISF
jgi:hypothetical protein